MATAAVETVMFLPLFQFLVRVKVEFFFSPLYPAGNTQLRKKNKNMTSIAKLHA